MAFENLISISFTPDELEQFDQAITTIETLIGGKVINLTPDQRMQYGRIAEQNKLFVNKAKEYMEQFPHLLPSFLDKTEFDRDHAARTAIEGRLSKLATITEKLSDTKVLLDHDNYHNGITFYRYIKFQAGENVPGTTNIYEGMRQFFTPQASKEENNADTK